MQMWQEKDNGSHCAVKTDSDSTGQGVDKALCPLCHWLSAHSHITSHAYMYALFSLSLSLSPPTPMWRTLFSLVTVLILFIDSVQFKMVSVHLGKPICAFHPVS